MTDHALVNAHYGLGSIMERVEAGLAAAGKNLEALTVDDLAPIDEFHTRGRASTLELAGLAGLTASDRVLDVGCGLGGTARHLAQTYGCRVDGIDLTQEYVDAGNQMTQWVGLSDRVTIEQGSALELPYDSNTFDVVWTEHAQMNIADKGLFYSEIARVLKPGGRFLFHDIFRGTADDEPVYPAPWAEEASLSALATEEQAKDAIEDAGMHVAHWIGKVGESIAFFDAVFEKIQEDGPPPIGIHLLMGDNAKVKLRNYVANLKSDSLAVAMGLARTR